MKAADRTAALLRKRPMTLDALAAARSVTTRTVKRDLSALRDRGVLRHEDDHNKDGRQLPRLYWIEASP